MLDQEFSGSRDHRSLAHSRYSDDDRPLAAVVSRIFVTFCQVEPPVWACGCLPALLLAFDNS